jgi:hypothetical protein
MHHMALGETIGYSTRIAMNNRTLYQTQSNLFPRAVYIALMGDPTLRQDQLLPPASVVTSNDNAGVHLTWTYAGPIEARFNIYRATSAGPFNRLNPAPVPSTNFTDVTAAPGDYTYMVRAVALQTNFSGSYFNLSQGTFANVTVAPPTIPIVLQLRESTNRVTLTWPSQAGVLYHVEASASPVSGTWRSAGASLPATGATNSWSETVTNSVRFYRVVSP